MMSGAVVAVAATPAPVHHAAPTRLRADGSNWALRGSALAFALAADARPIFTWSATAADRGARGVEQYTVVGDNARRFSRL